jgi:hypothetical protein
MAPHEFAILDAYDDDKQETQQERSFDGKTGRGRLDTFSFSSVTFVLHIPRRPLASLRRAALLIPFPGVISAWPTGIASGLSAIWKLSGSG